MTQYLGHKNRAHWNVSLWISNEEPLYREAVRLMRKYPKHPGRATFAMLNQLPSKTPDGYRYSFSAVKAALIGLEVS